MGDEREAGGTTDTPWFSGKQLDRRPSDSLRAVRCGEEGRHLPTYLVDCTIDMRPREEK